MCYLFFELLILSQILFSATNGKRKVIGRCTGDNTRRRKVQQQPRSHEGSPLQKSFDMEGHPGGTAVFKKECHNQHFNKGTYPHTGGIHPSDTRCSRISPGKIEENPETNFKRYSCINCQQRFQNIASLDKHKCSESQILPRRFVGSHYPPMHVPVPEASRYMPAQMIGRVEYMNNARQNMIARYPDDYENHARTRSAGHEPACSMNLIHRHYPEHMPRIPEFSDSQNHMMDVKQVTGKFRPV